LLTGEKGACRFSTRYCAPALAWALKEPAMAVYNYVYEKPGRKHF
jgi:hypothetical protein